MDDIFEGCFGCFGIGLIVALVVGVLFVFWLFGGLGALIDGLHGTQRDVETEVSFAAPGCPPDAPLALTIDNGSDRRVVATEIELVARRPQHSTDLSAQRLVSDRILEPGQRHTACFAVEPLAGDFPPEEAIWEIESKHIRAD